MKQALLENSKGIKKILILQLAGIGDSVIASPTIKALRARFKDAYIGLLVISRSAPLVENSPYIDALFVFDIEYTGLIDLFKKRRFIKVYRTIRELRRKRFDILINLKDIGSWKGAFKMALLFWLIGAKYKVGRDTDGRGLFLNVKIAEDSKGHKHEVEANLDVARALGSSIEKVKLEVPIFEEDKIFISHFFKGHGILDKDLLIGLNPGGFLPSRWWFEKRWAQLADELIEKYNCKIIITGYRNEKKMIKKIVDLIKKEPVITISDYTLKQLAALIKRFNLFITNDTGPMHIAVATETPLIALFGPGDIYKVSPYCTSDKGVVIRKEVDCRRPCYKVKCGNRKCMELITVEDVMNTAKGILA